MTDEIDYRALTQKWVHSHEEDTSEELVFRPESYKFPPSRGRMSFELSPNGCMIQHAIGADDRPNPKHGSWQIKDNNEIELLSGECKTIMRLVSVSPDKLVVKRGT